MSVHVPKINFDTFIINHLKYTVDFFLLFCHSFFFKFHQKYILEPIHPNNQNLQYKQSEICSEKKFHKFSEIQIFKIIIFAHNHKCTANCSLQVNRLKQFYYIKQYNAFIQNYVFFFFLDGSVAIISFLFLSLCVTIYTIIFGCHQLILEINSYYINIIFCKTML